MQPNALRSICEHLCSIDVSDRLMQAIGLRSPLTWSCNKIAPKPTGLASVIT